MATRGRTGWMRLLLGSVAASVLRRVAIPLLLLRPAPAPVAKPQKMGKIEKLQVSGVLN